MTVSVGGISAELQADPKLWEAAMKRSAAALEQVAANAAKLDEKLKRTSRAAQETADRALSLRDRADQLDTKMSRLQSAMGGVNQALGVQGGRMRDVVGGAADMAMAFAVGGPLMLGVTALTAGIALVVKEMNAQTLAQDKFADALRNKVVEAVGAAATRVEDLRVELENLGKTAAQIKIDTAVSNLGTSTKNQADAKRLIPIIEAQLAQNQAAIDDLPIGAGLDSFVASGWGGKAKVDVLKDERAELERQLALQRAKLTVAEESIPQDVQALKTATDIAEKTEQIAKGKEAAAAADQAALDAMREYVRLYGQGVNLYADSVSDLAGMQLDMPRLEPTLGADVGSPLGRQFHEANPYALDGGYGQPQAMASADYSQLMGAVEALMSSSGGAVGAIGAVTGSLGLLGAAAGPVGLALTVLLEAAQRWGETLSRFPELGGRAVDMVAGNDVMGDVGAMASMPLVGYDLITGDLHGAVERTASALDSFLSVIERTESFDRFQQMMDLAGAQLVLGFEPIFDALFPLTALVYELSYGIGGTLAAMMDLEMVSLGLFTAFRDLSIRLLNIAYSAALAFGASEDDAAAILGARERIEEMNVASARDYANRLLEDNTRATDDLTRAFTRSEQNLPSWYKVGGTEYAAIDGRARSGDGKRIVVHVGEIVARGNLRELLEEIDDLNTSTRGDRASTGGRGESDDETN